MNDTFDAIVDQCTVLIDDIPPKGPQVFNRNGFYYISVASTGKNKDKAQYVYRSTSLYGPYESRKIFHAGKADINAAQGSLVEVSGDRWAFLHHDYNLFATYGRRFYLEPAGWTTDGWPWIGVDTDGDGIGEPVGDRDYPYRTAWYEGTKVGLFCYNLSSAAEGGHADFDFFHQQHDGPKTTRKE